jgi:hypothetical protein
MYAPLRIGSRIGQTCCFLACRKSAYIPAKNAGTYTPPANLVEASWRALVDSITYKLKKEYGYRREARNE